MGILGKLLVWYMVYIDLNGYVIGLDVYIYYILLDGGVIGMIEVDLVCYLIIDLVGEIFSVGVGLVKFREVYCCEMVKVEELWGCLLVVV